LTAPEDQAPAPSEVDFIRRCIGNRNTVHYFTQHAFQWRWLVWLHENKLLSSLLMSSGAENSDHTRLLAHWAGRKLVHDVTGRGLQLLQEAGGRLGFTAWNAAAHELWLAKDIDFSQPGHSQWLAVIADSSRHQVQVDLLAYLLGKLAGEKNGTRRLIFWSTARCEDQD